MMDAAAAEVPQAQGVDPVPIPESPCPDAQMQLFSLSLDSHVSKVVDEDNFLIEMMDPASVPERVDPIPSATCMDAKRLRCSAMPANPVPKVLDDDNTSSWLAPVPPLEDENLLQEIFLRLPPQPSSLPRASFVCKHWGNILSDPQFPSRFRKHHRKAPLLGFFVGNALTGNPTFTPVMEPPDRIPSTRFSMPESHNPDESWKFTGCCHGLAVLVNQSRGKIAVWDPLTGQQHRVTFPPGMDTKRAGYFQATVLCVDAKDGHVHGDCFLSPFKLVFIRDMYKEAMVSLYDSVSGVWTDFVSTAIADTAFIIRPSILVRNAVYWLFYGGGILVFDIERQTLGVIKVPLDNYTTNNWCFQILRMEDGELGFAVLSEFTIKLWERKSKCDGVVQWVLQKTIPLEGILPWCNADETINIVGYDEDTNVIVLSTIIGNFMLQLDSMQTRHIIKRDHMSWDIFYPYTNFYTAGRGLGRKCLDLKL